MSTVVDIAPARGRRELLTALAQARYDAEVAEWTLTDAAGWNDPAEGRARLADAEARIRALEAQLRGE